ncbi:DUF1449 family protein [Rhodobacteraceae bacterium RKSG542]|uniref:OB-fold-containig protein n=1 Tax=Pseudovibrio flavus TaxID=2529854 RepID=UPI0012BD4778|nr:OB-fold-containig protein [Pseudovibrio flavus]MTI15804.1 DUF1449 family protein [Pseudovibrio flavus]
MEFLLNEAVFGFSLALALLLGLAAVEVCGLLFGLSISGLVDDALPSLEMEAPSFDVDADVDIDFSGPSAIEGFLAWLAVGKVPFAIFLVLFLTSFGLIGIVTQRLFWGYLGVLPSFWLVAIPTLALALIITGRLGHIIGRAMPKEETEAISRNALVGKIALITLGDATSSIQAEARYTDQHGTRHYIQVLSDSPSEVLRRGQEVLLISQEDGIYRAILNPHLSLSSVE